MSKGRVFQTRQSTSMDNHDHFSATERKPSVPHDGSRFPNLFPDRVVTDKDFEDPQERFNKQFPNKPPKRLQIAEQEQIIAEDGKGRREVVDQSIETEADCFIRQNHRRKPSVPHDGTRFPNVFRSRVVTFDEDSEDPQERFNKNFPNKPPKRLQIAEQEQIIAEDGKGRREVVDQSIETEADCFIRQNHRNFELRKWNTFKR